jgi:hypothetical protein
MTITKKFLSDWENSARIRFADEEKAIFLERFGTEPEPYEWSEQDIVEQIKNYRYCGHWMKPIASHGIGEVLPDGVEF